MKKVTVYSAVLLAVLAVQSCGDNKSTDIPASEVPASVMNAFNQKYPGATDVKWEKEMEKNKTEYEANYTLNGKHGEAEFDENGTFIKEE